MSTLRPPRQAGFSIVEVMVALVVLAVGMLGIASLYVTTLRTSGSAISRMQAVNLASDMADRIRANPFARASYVGAGADNECVGTKTCTRDEMAAHDVFLWKEQIEAVLPGAPLGRIDFVQAGAVPPGGGAQEAVDRYVITVSWKEQGTGDGDANRLSYALSMQVDATP